MTAATPFGLRERKKLATWRAVRSAALQLIDERGYDDVSIDEIAAAADVSRSTLFNYFPTKEALVLDPDPQDPQKWRALMGEQSPDAPLWAALEAVHLGYLDLFSERVTAAKKLKAISPRLGDTTRELDGQFMAEVHEWAASRTPPEHKVHTALMVNLAHGVILTAYELWSPDQGFAQMTNTARYGFDVAGRGIANPPDSSRRLPPPMAPTV
ncbi:AcrR family transcriptional regulator [Rhodococcus sp. 27YEA15]|uniref:TetR/AcrR family transcriptional regulator n=1 Tax=Rhodococcus sp. 27YEA15 TaxID=3156259 RepID=UPI003C7CCD76